MSYIAIKSTLINNPLERGTNEWGELKVQIVHETLMLAGCLVVAAPTLRKRREASRIAAYSRCLSQALDPWP